jgi:hypothetical protein
LLIALYSLRSERAFCEELEYNLLFRWFLDMDPSSQGLLVLSNDLIILNGSYEELARRIDGLTGMPSEPLRGAESFRGDFTQRTRPETDHLT